MLACKLRTHALITASLSLHVAYIILVTKCYAVQLHWNSPQSLA